MTCVAPHIPSSLIRNQGRAGLQHNPTTRRNLHKTQRSTPAEPKHAVLQGSCRADCRQINHNTQPRTVAWRKHWQTNIHYFSVLALLLRALHVSCAATLATAVIMLSTLMTANWKPMKRTCSHSNQSRLGTTRYLSTNLVISLVS